MSETIIHKQPYNPELERAFDISTIELLDLHAPRREYTKLEIQNLRIAVKIKYQIKADFPKTGDVDAVFEKIKKHGVEIVSPPENLAFTDYPYRCFQCKDTEGNLIEIAKYERK